MSGLFATLAAAARGDGAALAARPRGVFEGDARAASALDVSDGDKEQDDGLAVGEVSEKLRATGQLARPTDDDGYLVNKSGELSAAATRLGAAPDDLAVPGTTRADPTARNGRRAGYADQERPTPPLERVDRDAPLLLSRTNGRHDPATVERQAMPSAQPDHSVERSERSANADAILLPSNGREDDWASDTPSPSAPSSMDSRTRGPSKSSLTIGRIEVRPPPPTAAPPAPSYRAPTIPRAMPRQSLDDYRRRGR